MNKNIFTTLLAAFVAIISFASCETTEPTTHHYEITITSAPLTMIVGDVKTVTATVYPALRPGDNLIWENSNPAVATVDANGRVTAVAQGEVGFDGWVRGGGVGSSHVHFSVVVNSGILTQNTPTDAVANSGERLEFDWGIPTGGCPGGVTYLWQQSSDGQTWTSAPGVNTERNYTTQPITVNTYFRRLATDDCGETFSAETVRVTIPVWATSNVAAPGTFAANPQDTGMFFQWNRRQGWAATGDVTGWNSIGATGTAWETANDPCPDGWRVPTRDELEALNRRSWWVTNWNGTGVNGSLFGTAPNQIFLPAAGWRYTVGTLNGAGSAGLYWSGTQHDTAISWNLQIISGNSSVAWRSRAFGFSVRCVAE